MKLALPWQIFFILSQNLRRGHNSLSLHGSLKEAQESWRSWGNGDKRTEFGLSMATGVWRMELRCVYSICSAGPGAFFRNRRPHCVCWGSKNPGSSLPPMMNMDSSVKIPQLLCWGVRINPRHLFHSIPRSFLTGLSCGPPLRERAY